MGFGNESSVKIGRETVVLDMFTQSGLTALEDIHHALSNFEFAFLASVLASSSLRVMTKGLSRFSTPVTKLHLSRNMPPFIAFVTDLKRREEITELLSVCRVTARLSRNKQRERIHVTVSALDVLTDR